MVSMPLTSRLGLGAAMLTAAASLSACAMVSDRETDAFDRWTRTGERLYPDRERDDLESAAYSKRDADSELGDSPNLRKYIAYAMRNNPGLEAAFDQWKAALEAIPQARQLPEPTLSYTGFVRQSMDRQMVGLSQVFPWYRNVQREAGIAIEQARAAEHRFETRRLELIRELRQAYADYAYLAAAVEVMEQSLALAESLRDAAAARYEAGEAPYADLVRADVELAELEDRLQSLRRRREPVAARLSAVLGRDQATRNPLPWPEPLTPIDAELDRAALVQRLDEANPELLALKRESAGRRIGVAQARDNWIPDLTLGVQYMDMIEMDDQVALTGSVSIPLWRDALEAERAEALARFGAATRDIAQRRNELEAELEEARYSYDDASRRAALYRDRLIPLAEEAVEAAEAAYVAGQLEFQTLIDAQLSLLERELSYHRLVADQHQQRAAIDALVAAPLDHVNESEPEADHE